MHRYPVFFRQNRQSFITGYLILLRDLRTDRNDQIHRTDSILNKLYNVFGRIFYTEYDDLIFHAFSVPSCK